MGVKEGGDLGSHGEENHEGDSNDQGQRQSVLNEALGPERCLYVDVAFGHTDSLVSIERESGEIKGEVRGGGSGREAPSDAN